MSELPIIGRYFKKSPSVVVEYSGGSEVKERPPKWDLKDIYKRAESSWVLQMIYRTIISEVKRPGWEVIPKFKFKCEQCGREYQEKVDGCELCGGTEFRKPDWKEHAKAMNIIDKPNSMRQTWGDILTSIIYHDCVADDWYMSVGYAPVKSLGVWKPKEVYVEDPRYFVMMSDERGRMGYDADGRKQYFCPVCYPEQNNKVSNKPFKCSKCGGEAKPTSYVQKISGEIKNRFTTEQVVNGSTYKVLPYPYGNPRLVSLWELVGSLQAMDAWFWDTYKKGRVAQIINFPGYTPEQVKSMAAMIRNKESELDAIDPLYGNARSERRQKSLLLGSETPVIVHDIMPDPTKMKSLDYYQLGIQGVAGVYGAQLIFLAQEGGGRGQNASAAIRIDIQNRVIEEIQRDKEEIITNQLFPIFGISDFKFKFNPLEKKDELRDAQIGQIIASSAQTWVSAGFKVSVNDEGEISVEGEVDGSERFETMNRMVDQRIVGNPGKRPEGGPQSGVLNPKKPKESGASGREIDGGSTQSEPFGSRPAAGREG